MADDPPGPGRTKPSSMPITGERRLAKRWNPEVKGLNPEVGTPTNFLALELRTRARMESQASMHQEELQSVAVARALPYLSPTTAPVIRARSMQMQRSRGSILEVGSRPMPYFSSCDFAEALRLPPASTTSSSSSSASAKQQLSGAVGFIGRLYCCFLRHSWYYSRYYLSVALVRLAQ